MEEGGGGEGEEGGGGRGEGRGREGEGEGGGEGEEGRPMEVLLWKDEEGVSLWPPHCGRVLEASYFTACRAMQLKR